MSGKHTPGPWRTKRSGDETLIVADLDSPIYRTVHDRPGHEITKQTLATVYDFYDTSLPRDANASLIAAAPETKRQRDELLAALERLVLAAAAPSSPHVAGHGIDQSATDEGLTNCDILAAARAAIDKAAGPREANNETKEGEEI